MAFFRRAKRQSVPLFISRLVIDEIMHTPDEAKRKLLLDAVAGHALRFLPEEPADEITRLAQAYLETGALPVGEIDDALHVAVCTVHMVDVLASWNFKHLANVSRERRIMAVNERLGYVYPLRIVSPEGVLEDESES